MDIPLEQSIGSIVRYITDTDTESIKTYFDEVPDGFAVPSLYFPIPYIEGRKVSLRSYRNTITFEVWVLDRSNWEAAARAAVIRDALMTDGLRIPIYDEDGDPTGKIMRVQEPKQRKIEKGVVTVTFGVQEYFHWEGTPATKVKKVYTDLDGKF